MLDSSETAVLRWVKNSYVRKAARVSSTTTPLVSSMTAISFHFIGSGASHITSGLWYRDVCESQQLGTYHESGRPRRFRIDLQTYPTVFREKSDHAPCTYERRIVAHREHRPGFQFFQNRAEMSYPFSVNEEDVTRVDILQPFEAFNLQRVTFDGFPRHDFVEVLAKWIFTQHPNDDWIVLRGETPIGPFNKLCEMKKKDGLYFVFVRHLRGSVESQRLHGRKDPACPYYPKHQPVFHATAAFYAIIWGW